MEKKYVFDLGVGDTIQIGAEIDKIMKKSSSVNSEQSEIVCIPPGDFQVKVTLRLFGTGNSLKGTNLESEFIKVQLADKETTK